jgi:hypothetical protein
MSGIDFVARQQETSLLPLAPSTSGEAAERIFPMSTGPGPTRKADGSADASVDDIADLLVEDDAHRGKVESEQPLDDGLDVMLETPGPVLVNNFLPPPPSPIGSFSEEPESSDTDEAGGSTNLAYEDLLAKLVLPAKAPEPEPAMPALASPLPMPEPDEAPTPIPAITPFSRQGSSNLQLASPSDERTLVTANPLVAEEQEAAVREGRSAFREQPPIVREEAHPLVTEPMAMVNGGAKSRLIYLMLGGLLVLGGMILAVLVLKLLMPSPAPQQPILITPSPPPPPSMPPAKVEPLPPSAPVAPAAAAVHPTEPRATAPENTPAPTEQAPSVDTEIGQPRPHKPTHPKAVSHTPTPKPAPAPKAASTPTPKASPVPAAKPTKSTSSKKSSKSTGWADPFDN